MNRPQEHSAPFAAEMVRAVLADLKTETRRIVAPGNCYFGSADRDFWQHCDLDAPSCFADNGYLHVPCHCQGDDGLELSREVDCKHCKEFGWEGTRHRLYPKWAAGDFLRISEAVTATALDHELYQLHYHADNSILQRYGTPELIAKIKAYKQPHLRGVNLSAAYARPDRLLLKEVRVERLQEISEADAIAEGARHFPDIPLGNLSRFSHSADRWSCGTPTNTDQCVSSARWAFANLWTEINGPESWALNPWVWVLAFKRIESEVPRAQA